MPIIRKSPSSDSRFLNIQEVRLSGTNKHQHEKEALNGLDDFGNSGITSARVRLGERRWLAFIVEKNRGIILQPTGPEPARLGSYRTPAGSDAPMR